jgi:hypothetical protein
MCTITYGGKSKRLEGVVEGRISLELDVIS